MIAFDTNILVYYFDERVPEKRAKARELIAGATDGVVVWQAACEFIAATRKLTGFTPADAWESLYDFLAVFPLIIPGAEALSIARSLHVDQGVSFWDSVLLGTCKEAGITRVYSEDLPGGKVPGLEVVNPFG
jgi:predicted nucleic acid-binding protein